MNELKPCPFCGCMKPQIWQNDRIICPRCNAEGPAGDGDAGAAVEYWNARTLDEEQAEGVLQREYCNQQSLTSSRGWISVEDKRKPELGQVILMWVYAEDEGEDDDGRSFSMDKSQVQMGEYRDMGHGPFFDCFATPFADREGVTHWMPMPKPPEGGA